MAAKRRWTAMRKDDLPLEQLIDSYQFYNRAVGKSASTVASYGVRLGLFGRFLGEEATLEELTVDSARAYIVHLQDRTDRHAGSPFVITASGRLSTAYIHGCVRAIRAFASWLYAKNYTETNRLKVVKPPKVQHKVIPVQRYVRWSPSGANGRSDSRRCIWRLIRIAVPGSRPPCRSVTSRPLCARPSTPACRRRRRESQGLPDRRTRGTWHARMLRRRSGAFRPR